MCGVVCGVVVCGGVVSRGLVCVTVVCGAVACGAMLCGAVVCGHVVRSCGVLGHALWVWCLVLCCVGLLHAWVGMLWGCIAAL